MLILATAPLAVTNSPVVMEHALKFGLPIESMSLSNQILVSEVAEHCTLQRTVPPRRFPGRAENFGFMLDHMEISGVLAEKAGIIGYRPVMSPDGKLLADNKQEAAGFLIQVYCSEGRCIYYVEGTDRGMLTTRGQGVVVVDYKQVTPTEVEYSGEVYVRIDNGMAATLARLFYVFLRKSVDTNFAHVMRQPICLTELITENPQSLRTMIDESPGDDQQLLSPLEPLLSATAH
jgi:hypothetical protein